LLFLNLCNKKIKKGLKVIKNGKMETKMNLKQILLLTLIFGATTNSWAPDPGGPDADGTAAVKIDAPVEGEPVGGSERAEEDEDAAHEKVDKGDKEGHSADENTADGEPVVVGYPAGGEPVSTEGATTVGADSNAPSYIDMVKEKSLDAVRALRGHAGDLWKKLTGKEGSTNNHPTGPEGESGTEKGKGVFGKLHESAKESLGKLHESAKEFGENSLQDIKTKVENAKKRANEFYDKVAEQGKEHWEGRKQQVKNIKDSISNFVHEFHNPVGKGSASESEGPDAAEPIDAEKKPVEGPKSKNTVHNLARDAYASAGRSLKSIGDGFVKLGKDLNPFGGKGSAREPVEGAEADGANKGVLDQLEEQAQDVRNMGYVDSVDDRAKEKVFLDNLEKLKKHSDSEIATEAKKYNKRGYKIEPKTLREKASDFLGKHSDILKNRSDRIESRRGKATKLEDTAKNMDPGDKKDKLSARAKALEKHADVLDKGAMTPDQKKELVGNIGKAFTGMN
jgi:F0F1-type ATP synthase membrane subunit b/b'